MDTIHKKINIGTLKSHNPGNLPYLKSGQGDFFVDGVNGNWNSFPINIPVVQDGKVLRFITYNELLKHYHRFQKQINEGIKLKRIHTGDTISDYVYTTRFKEDFPSYTDEEQCSFNDINSFAVDDKGNYHPEVNYTNNFNPNTKYTVLIADWQLFNNDIGFGDDCVGYDAYKRILGYLKEAEVKTVEGTISYENLLEKYGISDDTIKKEDFIPTVSLPLMIEQNYDDFGVFNTVGGKETKALILNISEGDDTYELRVHSALPTDEELEIKLVDAVGNEHIVNIEQKQWDGSIIVEKENIVLPILDYEVTGDENIFYSLIKWHEEEPWQMESRLNELRVPQREFDDEGNVLPYIKDRVTGEYLIPYRKCENIEEPAENEIYNIVQLESTLINNTKYDAYSCDYIKAIKYKDTEDSEEWSDVPTETTKFVEFEYVIGAKLINQGNVIVEECVLEITQGGKNINEVSISAGSEVEIDVYSPTCDWESEIIYEGEDFLQVLNTAGEEYEKGGDLYIDVFTKTIDIIINTTTRWQLFCDKCEVSQYKGDEGIYKITLVQKEDFSEDDKLNIRYGSDYSKEFFLSLKETMNGKTFTIEPDTYEYECNSEKQDIGITLKTNVNWAISVGSSWASVYYDNGGSRGEKVTGGNDEGTTVMTIPLIIGIEENYDWNSRESKISFISGKYGHDIVIKQGEPDYISVFKTVVDDPISEINFSGNEITDENKVYTNVESGWTLDEIKYEPYIAAYVYTKDEETQEDVLTPASQLVFSSAEGYKDLIIDYDGLKLGLFRIDYQGETTDDKPIAGKTWIYTNELLTNGRLKVSQNTTSQARYASLFIEEDSEKETEEKIIVRVDITQNKAGE